MDNNHRLPRIDIIEFIEYYCPEIKSNITLELTSMHFNSGNISYFELVTLITLIRQFKSINIIEFGTFNGRTTVNLALNCEDNCFVYTVDLLKENMHTTKFPLADGKHDPNDELGFIGHSKKTSVQPQHIKKKIIQIWSDTALITKLEYENKFDFIFVDASHSYENCLNDSYTAIDIVKNNGIIAWHDYNGWPGVTRALNEFSELNSKLDFYWINDTSIVVTKNTKVVTKNTKGR